MVTGKRVLVTGGCGFIGSHIVQGLLDRGATVRVLDNLSTGYLANIRQSEHCEFVQGDIRNAEDCRRAVEGCDLICHQAALGSVPRSMDTPHETFSNNAQGFVEMLTAARNAGVRRVVFASSSAVYGNSNHDVNVEGREGTLQSPYALSKKHNEDVAKMFRDLFGLETIGLRYHNVFGPRQNVRGEYVAVVPIFATHARDDKKLRINGDGTQSRDFTFVDNVVHANLLALETTAAAAFGEVFNVGLGSNTSVNDIAKAVLSLANKDPAQMITHVSPRAGDIQRSQADISKLKKVLGFTPQTTFEVGLKMTVEHYLNKQ